MKRLTFCVFLIMALVPTQGKLSCFLLNENIFILNFNSFSNWYSVALLRDCSANPLEEKAKIKMNRSNTNQ